MRDLIIKSETSTTVEVECVLGGRLHRLCEEACKLATEKMKEVILPFNGVVISVVPMANPTLVEESVHQKLREAAEAWKQSPAGIAYAEKQQYETKKRQQVIDNLLQDFYTSVAQEASLVVWVGKFAAANDWIGVHFNNQGVADNLKAFGYVRNDCVGIGKIACASSRRIFARLLIGQAIDHLESGMPIHPALEPMSKRYFTIHKA